MHARQRGAIEAAIGPAAVQSHAHAAPARTRLVHASMRPPAPTTVPVSRWAVVSGASYAAAHVSGLLALMHEASG